MSLAERHLAESEAEAIHIVREAIAQARNPVVLFSAGKDSTVLAHIALPETLDQLRVMATIKEGDVVYEADRSRTCERSTVTQVT